MGLLFRLIAVTGALVFQSTTAQAQTTPPPSPPSPGEIVAAAPKADWTAIAPDELMVMDLAPQGKKPRRVIIQLMPAPFSQGWVGNIRKLAAARWWDGTSINRVQDNYVVQWGDATETKALPDGLVSVPEAEYTATFAQNMFSVGWRYGRNPVPTESQPTPAPLTPPTQYFDPYSPHRSFAFGFPVGFSEVVITKADERFDAKLKYTVRYSVPDKVWPVHCYGMVGVGRNLSPDTGSGAELYAVIGHAPRHLDRNIALVGRVIEGMEHLSSLPRGTGSLGFYESAKERVPIRSVRIGTAAKDLPAFEYLNSDSESFARYAEARANRRDPFFVQPAGGADICNIPVPVRRVL